MKLQRTIPVAGLLGVFLFMGAAAAETKVTVSKMHLCCGACYKAVEKAIDGVEGASVEFDKKAKSTTITAGSDEVAQKAVNAIAAAGFHGQSDNKKIAMPEDSGVKPGKVKRLELTGVHNCCGGCNRALDKALDSVDGVEDNTAKPRAETFVVEGDFDAAALVKALNGAGFHVKVKK